MLRANKLIINNVYIDFTPLFLQLAILFLIFVVKDSRVLIFVVKDSDIVGLMRISEMNTYVFIGTFVPCRVGNSFCLGKLVLVY